MSMVGGSGADRGHVITMTRTPSVRCQAPPPGPPSLASYFWICAILAPSPPPSGAGPDHEPVWGTTSQSRSLGPIRQLSRQAALRMRRGLQSVCHSVLASS